MVSFVLTPKRCQVVIITSQIKDNQKVKPIFVFVKKLAGSILFSLAILIIIAHDAIHHHHTGFDDIEFSWSGASDQHDEENDSHEHNFPVHHHIISEGDLFQARNTFIISKIIKDQQTSTLYSEITDTEKICTPIISSLMELQENNELSPYLISLNNTRGSPRS